MNLPKIWALHLSQYMSLGKWYGKVKSDKSYLTSKSLSFLHSGQEAINALLGVHGSVQCSVIKGVTDARHKVAICLH